MPENSSEPRIRLSFKPPSKSTGSYCSWKINILTLLYRLLAAASDLPSKHEWLLIQLEVKDSGVLTDLTITHTHTHGRAQRCPSLILIMQFHGDDRVNVTELAAYIRSQLKNMMCIYICVYIFISTVMGEDKWQTEGDNRGEEEKRDDSRMGGERGGDPERQTVLNLSKPRDFWITFGN